MMSRLLVLPIERPFPEHRLPCPTREPFESPTSFGSSDLFNLALTRYVPPPRTSVKALESFGDVSNGFHGKLQDTAPHQSPFNCLSSPV